MRNENSSKRTTTGTMDALDLVPGVFVRHDGRLRQVRGVSTSESIGVGENGSTQYWSAMTTVVFCDANGQITTEEFAPTYEFEVAFVEVFEPSIPEGYVSRKNFRKCYEDALADVESTTPSSTVNKGSRWKAKRDLNGVLLQKVVEGEICVAYDIGKDGLTCRLMRERNGGDLGNIGTASLKHDFFSLPEEPAPPVKEGAIQVKLTYFKPSGKYYSDGVYFTEKKTFWEIVDEVYEKLLHGDNPGLTNEAVLRNDFTTSVAIQDERVGVPHVITAQALCVEIMRKSNPAPMAYALTAPKPALALFERHRKSIEYMLPDELKQVQDKGGVPL